MILNVTKNEYPYYPDVQNNLELPEKDRFTFVLRKTSYVIDSQRWSEYDENGNYILNKDSFVRAHVVRIENAPELKPLDDSQSSMVLDLDILLSRDWPQLIPIREALFLAIGENNEKEVDVKK